MNPYCSQCGNRMEEDYAYCPECGTPSLPEQKKPRKPIKLPKKAIVSIASGLVVVLVTGAYFTGQYLTDEDRLVSRFEKIAVEGDADKLHKLLSASNEDVQFDRKTADALAAYFKNNEDIVEELANELRSEAEELAAGDVRSFREEEDAPFLYLEKKEKKKWLIFNEYELKLKRYMIPVRTNFEGASVEIDGKEVGEVSPDRLSLEAGPFLPGKYEVKVVYEGEYTTLESKRDYELFPMGAYDDGVELELQGDYVYVYADHADADIYVNGESIGLKADGSREIGPISLDGSNTMYVQAEYPWGTAKSEEQPVVSELLEFSIDPLTDEAKEAIMASASAFAKSWIEATQAQDATLATNLSQGMLERLYNNLSTYEFYGQLYFGEVTKLTYDLNSFQVYQNGDGTYSASVNVREELNEAVAYPESDYEWTPTTADMQYLLDYEDGSWIVAEAYTIFDFNDSHTKVYE